MLVKAMKKESKKPMVDYLELDNNTYIENDVIKTRVSDNDNRQEFVPWDEFWSNIYISEWPKSKDIMKPTTYNEILRT